MPDIRIRKNEKCVIGLPACDYVFSATRSCFIAYGFRSSNLEKDILRDLLEKRGVEAVQAGDRFEPAKYAFCTKICSKIITSQFCIALMNNDVTERNGKITEAPNANVNMEYGLMLGHNKYIIPFQLENQTLPFNVSGLDTMKYNTRNFRDLAARSIDQAISETSQNIVAPSIDQIIESFLLTQNTTLVNLQINPGDRMIFEFGAALKFNLLTKFDGLSYVYFGNFTSLRTEAVLWHIVKLIELLTARLQSVEIRTAVGLTDASSLAVLEEFRKRLELWVLVNSDVESAPVKEWLNKQTLPFQIMVFEISQVMHAVSQIP